MRQPAIDLALVEALGLAESLEPARLPVDAREPGDGIDELVGETLSRFEVGIERCRPAGVDIGDQPSTYSMR